LESKEVDGRADIFSFGAVVHEMATGKKAFPGETQASIIAKILDHAPPPVSSLEPPGKLSPPALDRIVEKCLRKDREDRWQSARDVTDELKWIKEGGAEGRSLTVAARIAPQWLGWAAAAILLISTAVVSLVHFRETPPEVRPARFFVLPPEKTNFSTAGPAFLSVSPDGARLAFVATSVSGANPQLWVRPLDSLSAQPLPGTEGAFQPFWSPDSRFLAFVAQGKLKKIDVTGGPPQVLCDAAGGGGSGAWNREGVILFTPESGGVGPIYRVSAAGGAATAITTPDASQGERGHLWPHFLPDGKHFLYLALNKSTEKSAIRVGSLDSKDSKVLLNAHSFVRYAPPGPPSVGLGPQDGYLLFQRDGTLMAQAFDADALELAGEAFPIAEKVQVNPSNGRVALGVSENGVLAYRSTGNLNTQLAWFDRSGKELSRIGEPGGTISPKLSPDEKQVAVTRATDIGVSGDIWVLDLSRSTQTRLTFDAADDSAPIWSPDGSRIAFASTRGNAFGLYQKNSNGIGEEELLVKTSDSAIPEDWSLDGRFLVYLTTGRGGRDVSVLPLSGERKPAPFLQGPFYERHAQLSPDGRWMAYASDESGQYQIYVQSFPAGGGKWQVSTTGGSQPRWRHDGKELFYIALDGKLMSVPVRAGATFEAGTPVPLFQTQIFGLGVGQLYSQQYDVTADGQRFLINMDLAEATAAPITVVLNWQKAVTSGK
jgi:Tol biopolymer transport system component